MSDQQNNPYRSTGIKFEAASIECENFEGIIRVNQIIVLALTMGLAFFIGFAIFQFSQGNALLNWKPSVLAVVGWVVGASAIPASFIIPSLMGHATRQKEASSNESTANLQSKFLQSYQSQLIVGCALLEGPAFLNTYAFMADNHPGSIAAAVVLAVVLLSRIPSRLRVQYWMATQMEGR